MKFSDEFYKLYYKIENFASLPNNHPHVIAVQQMAEMELLAMERIKAMKLQLSMQDLLGEIHRDTMTPVMYYYLINKGLESAQIYEMLNIPKHAFNLWKQENNLRKNELYYYDVYVADDSETLYGNTSDSDIVERFDTFPEVVKFLAVSQPRAYEAITWGTVIIGDPSRTGEKGRYLIEKYPRFEPSLEEALDVSSQETLTNWLDNRKNKQIRRGAGRTDKVKVLMADIFGEGGEI